MEIQSNMTSRALELLSLDEDGPPALILDLGCGSGLSGECIEEHGHHWVGVDISEAMLSTCWDYSYVGDNLEEVTTAGTFQTLPWSARSTVTSSWVT